MNEETYIGDGVYASFDGYQIWLRTERDGMTHRIALELPVYYELAAYAEKIINPLPHETEGP